MSYIFVIILCFAAFAAVRMAQARYEQAIARGRRVMGPEGKTGADIAAEFLAAHGAGDVQIVRYNAVVSDYFDPARRRLFLRAENHDGTDLSAWAVALHEAAHALQAESDMDALKWRRMCIGISRYVPMAAAILALVATLIMKRPARMSLMALGAVLLVTVLLNLGSLAVEFNANKRVLLWLDERLRRHPDSLDKLQQLLGPMATREVGDVLSSPRYFFLSALPGTSRSRPGTKKETEVEKEK